VDGTTTYLLEAIDGTTTDQLPHSCTNGANL
jgi:hypothetical protein